MTTRPDNTTVHRDLDDVSLFVAEAVSDYLTQVGMGRIGFAIMLVTYGEQGTLNCTSNVKRDELRTLLLETAEHMKEENVHDISVH
jgi:hypothetical protein